VTRALVAIFVIAFVAGFARSCAHDVERRFDSWRLHRDTVYVGSQEEWDRIRAQAARSEFVDQQGESDHDR